ncbi:MAG: hypothetical protein RL154_1121 [Pseudomonadota bacterium]|jgi:hypothetical protein
MKKVFATAILCGLAISALVAADGNQMQGMKMEQNCSNMKMGCDKMSMDKNKSMKMDQNNSQMMHKH